jgi:hypothetical protein
MLWGQWAFRIFRAMPNFRNTDDLVYYCGCEILPYPIAPRYPFLALGESQAFKPSKVPDS